MRDIHMSRLQEAQQENGMYPVMIHMSLICTTVHAQQIGALENEQEPGHAHLRRGSYDGLRRLRGSYEGLRRRGGGLP